MERGARLIAQTIFGRGWLFLIWVEMNIIKSQHPHFDELYAIMERIQGEIWSSNQLSSQVSIFPYFDYFSYFELIAMSFNSSPDFCYKYLRVSKKNYGINIKNWGFNSAHLNVEYLTDSLLDWIDKKFCNVLNLCNLQLVER